MAVNYGFVVLLKVYFSDHLVMLVFQKVYYKAIESYLPLLIHLFFRSNFICISNKGPIKRGRSIINKLVW